MFANYQHDLANNTFLHSDSAARFVKNFSCKAIPLHGIYRLRTSANWQVYMLVLMRVCLHCKKLTTSGAVGTTSFCSSGQQLCAPCIVKGVLMTSTILPGPGLCHSALPRNPHSIPSFLPCLKKCMLLRFGRLLVGCSGLLLSPTHKNVHWGKSKH